MTPDSQVKGGGCSYRPKQRKTPLDQSHEEEVLPLSLSLCSWSSDFTFEVLSLSIKWRDPATMMPPHSRLCPNSLCFSPLSKALKLPFVFAFYCISDYMTPLFKSSSYNDFVLLIGFDPRRGWSPLTTAFLGSFPLTNPYSLAQVLPAWDLHSFSSTASHHPLDCFPSLLFPLTSSTYPSISPEVLASAMHSLTPPPSFLAPYSFHCSLKPSTAPLSPLSQWQLKLPV